MHVYNIIFNPSIFLYNQQPSLSSEYLVIMLETNRIIIDDGLSLLVIFRIFYGRIDFRINLLDYHRTGPDILLKDHLQFLILD